MLFRGVILSKLSRLIAVAKGDELADLILADARVINTFNGEVEPGNVAVCEGRVAGVGDYRKAKEVLDLSGRYLAPGLINGHTHLESSMLDVGQYARAVVPHGTSALVTDLHEIANVCGLEGLCPSPASGFVFDGSSLCAGNASGDIGSQPRSWGNSPDSAVAGLYRAGRGHEFPRRSGRRCQRIE